LGALSSPINVSSEAGDEVEKRDSHGCYGQDSSQWIPKDEMVSAITAGCNRLGSNTIAIGKEIGTFVSTSGGHSVYINFRSNNFNGWFVNPGFCTNVMHDILNKCTWKLDGVQGSTGGSWTYDNQGIGNLDTQ
jgi:hypothetical protein